MQKQKKVHEQHGMKDEDGSQLRGLVVSKMNISPLSITSTMQEDQRGLQYLAIQLVEIILI
jgi:hypothetical protein